ncbi:hypothetical protein BT67DRAFT_445019 [Trichocladium antarcticum]|uniref:Myb transcription factor n=1 Tax=Trichocladium antarcticum TaxID=1450529 RepID=A0AAN6UDI5_9PEZI|nr:hypothetical protein BT67DRAFT_445019 [Trichocladium antarcticum]
MGQDVSRPEMPEGRARSLSPLPRDDHDDPVDDLRTFPSTMPPYTGTLRPRPSLSSAQQSPPLGRRERSHGPSPDEGLLSAASQPAQSVPRAEPPDQSRRPASQPESSNGKRIRFSKRSSLAGKSRIKPETTDANGVPAGENAVVPDPARSGKKGKRKSAAAHLDDPAPAALIADVVPTQDGSPGQDLPNKKSKRKDKEVARDAVRPTIFDFDDEDPPSAQPSAKRSRRSSISESRKKRRLPRPSDGGLRAEVRAAPFGGPAELNTFGARASPVDNIKAEQEERDEPLRAARLELVVEDEPGMDVSVSDGLPEPVVKGESGMDVAVPDGLPHHQGNSHPETNGTNGQSHANGVSVTPEPHELPAVPALASPQLGAHDENIKTENTADAISAQDDSVLGADDEIARTPSSVVEDDSASDGDTTAPGAAVRNGGGSESSNSMGRPPTPVEDVAEIAETPPASSPTSPGSPHTRRRKATVPSSPHEDTETANANAFAELPLDDVAAQPTRKPKSKRPKVSASSVEAEAGPSRSTNGVKRKKSTKQKVKTPAVVETAADDSDDQDPARKQYRSGALSMAEQNQITRAVERFRDAESMTQQEVNQIIHENPQTSGQATHARLWASIQDACSSRPRQKLINWCRQRFHNFAGRGVWTPEQDDELAGLVDIHGKKWSLISGLINRHQKDARDRWRNYLVCRDSVKTDTWSKDEEERLRDLVEAAIEKIQEGPRRKNRKAREELINWATISEAMDHTRSRLQCSTKWKDICASEPIPSAVPTVLPAGNSWRLQKARKDLRKMTAQDKYELMRTIRDSGAGTDIKINWRPVVSQTFHDQYERQALVVVWGRLRQAVPGWERKTTRDCARYLCEMYEREGDFGVAEPEGAEESEGAGQSGDDLPDEAAVPSNRKGKRVQRQPPAAAGSPSPSPSETAASHTKQSPRPSEREESPELGTGLPPPSPSVAVQAGRTKRRAKRESMDSAGETPGGRAGEREARKEKKKKERGSKRPRRESLPDDSTESSQTSKKKKKKKLKTGPSPPPAAGEKAWSVISSDMDDMEDIPATLPPS